MCVHGPGANGRRTRGYPPFLFYLCSHWGARCRPRALPSGHRRTCGGEGGGFWCETARCLDSPGVRAASAAPHRPCAFLPIPSPAARRLRPSHPSLPADGSITRQVNASTSASCSSFAAATDAGPTQCCSCCYAYICRLSHARSRLPARVPRSCSVAVILIWLGSSYTYTLD